MPGVFGRSTDIREIWKLFFKTEANRPDVMVAVLYNRVIAKIDLHQMMLRKFVTVIQSINKSSFFKINDLK